ncbi:MAG: hypothetical protein K2P86_04935 [Xanthobacteraceae bacterium]|nr:hypothetical protein [Xanthobacteraceae bacterium]
MQTDNIDRHPGFARGPEPFSGLSLYLPIAIVLVSNLIPLIGVVYWGWSTFVLLMLYWAETVIIAFWTLMRILVGGDFAKNVFGEIFGRLFMFVFFLVHSTGFMLGHFIFLWAFYSGVPGRNTQLSDAFFQTLPHEFWNGIVLANGLLIPLAVSFVGRGAAFVIEMAKLPLWKRLVDQDNVEGRQAGALVGGLYTRIVIMHLVILGGAALAQKYGALAPLILLIAAKTVVDLWLFIKIDLQGRGTTPVDTVNVK